MKLHHAHDWDVTPGEARILQKKLAVFVNGDDDLGEVHKVAGVDVGFLDQGAITRAAIAVLSFPDLDLVDQAIAHLPTSFPYVPGLLSFREIPAVLKAMEQLKQCPDLIVCDGQGIAHPRRFGIACHLGVLTGLPTIGVAKTRLIGQYKPVPATKGDWTPLYDGSELIGAVVRTRAGVKPVFVSTGHRVSLASAIHYAMGCVTRYRLPETTRMADRLASDKTQGDNRA